MKEPAWKAAARKEIEKANRRLPDESLEELRVGQMESVDLIASGYEWTCPDEDCDTLNYEIEITDTVICDGCKMEYRVSEANHAHS